MDSLESSPVKKKKKVVYPRLFGRHVRTVGRKTCHCFEKHSTDNFPYERRCITECILHSLDCQNSEAILALTKSYESKYASTKSVLKEVVGLLLDTAILERKKDMAEIILTNQMYSYPSCHPETTSMYTSLLSVKEESFKDLTMLEYTLGLLEQLLCRGHECFSANRVSLRTKKPNILFDEYTDHVKKEDVKPSIDDLNDNPESRNARLKDRLLWGIKVLCEILEHDLISVLNRFQPVKTSIISRFVFRGDNMGSLNKAFLSKLFELFRKSAEMDVKMQINLTKLIKLVAMVCEVADGMGEINLSRMGGHSQEFFNDLLIHVFGDLKSESESFLDLMEMLPFDWMRYYAAHFIFERLSERRLKPGVEGVFCELTRINESNKPKVLEEVDMNLEPHDRTKETVAACRKDDIDALTRLFECSIDFSTVTDKRGRSVLHLIAKFGSMNCAKFILKKSNKKLDVHMKDYKGVTPIMYTEQNAFPELQNLFLKYADTDFVVQDKRLSPYRCRLMLAIIIASETITDKKNEADTIQYLRELSGLVKEIEQVIFTPNELKVISYNATAIRRRLEAKILIN